MGSSKRFINDKRLTRSSRSARLPLFRSPKAPAGAPTTIPGSTDLGTYQVGGYSRFTGVFQSVGSMTLQWQMGTHSGDYQVTSSILISSGQTIFDQLNHAIYVNFSIIAANSQTPDYLIIGEPIR